MKTDRRGWTRKTLDLLASWVWLAAVGVTVLETVGCAGVSTTPTPISVSVTISPILATVAAGGTQQFSAVVQNTSNTAVTWQVNGVTGGNATVGTISSSGLYTAPGVVPKSKSCLPLHRSEEHTSELQSRFDLVCRLLLEKKKINIT